jgi:hypothetical protein
MKKKSYIETVWTNEFLFVLHIIALMIFVGTIILLIDHA